MDYTKIIKEIGRGKIMRATDRQTAFELYQAMLAGAVPELELGGILIALRIKGRPKRRCWASTGRCSSRCCRCRRRRAAAAGGAAELQRRAQAGQPDAAAGAAARESGPAGGGARRAGRQYPRDQRRDFSRPGCRGRNRPLTPSSVSITAKRYSCRFPRCRRRWRVSSGCVGAWGAQQRPYAGCWRRRSANRMRCASPASRTRSMSAGWRRFPPDRRSRAVDARHGRRSLRQPAALPADSLYCRRRTARVAGAHLAG